MKLIALLIAASGVVQTSPRQFFGNDYDTALALMQKDRPVIAQVALQNQVSQNLLCALVFPEYLRYSYLSGLVETASLELLYVQWGSTMADFSIGHFQMKPSFAETVEAKTRSLPGMAHRYSALLIKQPSPRKVRAVRVQRLGQTRMQALYACAFVELCRQQYALAPLPEEEQLKYLAAIYNRGLQQGRSEIEKSFEVRTFPHGARYKGVQFAYWEVALDYYLSLKQETR